MGFIRSIFVYLDSRWNRHIPRLVRRPVHGFDIDTDTPPLRESLGKAKERDSKNEKCNTQLASDNEKSSSNIVSGSYPPSLNNYSKYPVSPTLAYSLIPSKNNASTLPASLSATQIVRGETTPEIVPKKDVSKVIPIEETPRVITSKAVLEPSRRPPLTSDRHQEIDPVTLISYASPLTVFLSNSPDDSRSFLSRTLDRPHLPHGQYSTALDERLQGDRSYYFELCRIVARESGLKKNFEEGDLGE